MNKCEDCSKENTNVEIITRWQDPTILVTDTEKAIKDLQQRVEQLENIRKDIAEYVKSKEFAENFPYVMNECQVRSTILKILDKKEVN